MSRHVHRPWLKKLLLVQLVWEMSGSRNFPPKIAADHDRRQRRHDGGCTDDDGSLALHQLRMNTSLMSVLNSRE